MNNSYQGYIVKKLYNAPIMLESLWALVALALNTSCTNAQRIPLTLLHVIETPIPVPHTTTPFSHSPNATAFAAFEA